MIRIGMNKKSAEPVNVDYPFYYTKNGVYTPVRNLFITGPSRSFYGVNSAGRKIKWMETNSEVDTNIPSILPSYISKIYINKYYIIEEKDLPCSIETLSNTISCNEFKIDGPSLLVYDSNDVSRSVYILAYGNVTVLT